MKVLYVSHTSHISGGERSLLSLLSGLPSEVEAHVACPPGPLAAAVRSQGLEPLPLPAIEGSLKLHLVGTARALADMGRAALAVRLHANAVRADVVHANSIRAGLMAGLAARAGGTPTVTHVRDCLPAGRVSSWSRRLVCSQSAVVLANSRHTAKRFVVPDARAAVRVAYSPIDMTRFDPARTDRAEARERFGLASTETAVGVVAQLTPWKGQEEAIRVAGSLKRTHPEVKLLLAGSAKFVSSATRLDNRSYVRRLERLVDELGASEQVTFLGEREDVPQLLRALDILLVPSWEEPFGRSVVEGMAMGLPVVATEAGGPAEIIGDGEGLLLPPGDTDRWVAELDALIADPGARAEIGRRGRSAARSRFGVAAHVEGVLAAYAEARTPGAQRSTFRS